MFWGHELQIDLEAPINLNNRWFRMSQCTEKLLGYKWDSTDMSLDSCRHRDILLKRLLHNHSMLIRFPVWSCSDFQMFTGNSKVVDINEIFGPFK